MDGYQKRFSHYSTVNEREILAQKRLDSLKRRGFIVQDLLIKTSKKRGTLSQTAVGRKWFDFAGEQVTCPCRKARARSYLRHGAVCHHAIKKGVIEALVSGKELYTVKIKIQAIREKRWSMIKDICKEDQDITSALLQDVLTTGLSSGIISVLEMLFPSRHDIVPKCNCQDSEPFCKHIIAALFGVGIRLDRDFGTLFTLRGVNRFDLVKNKFSSVSRSLVGQNRLLPSELRKIFHIDLL